MGEKKRNKRKIGIEYEDKAVTYLQERGYEIIERNYYTPYGEIDIIAKEGNILVFVEVKYRGNHSLEAALEAVDNRKQSRIVKSALCYFYRKKYCEDVMCRFDVIAFDKERMQHVKNAFEMV